MDKYFVRERDNNGQHWEFYGPFATYESAERFIDKLAKQQAQTWRHPHDYSISVMVTPSNALREG